MTSQGIYYLIRALVALVAIPFHKAAGPSFVEPFCTL